MKKSRHRLLLLSSPYLSPPSASRVPTARAAKESASAAMVCAKCKIPSPPRGPRFSPAGFGRFVFALGVPCRDLFFFLLIFP